MRVLILGGTGLISTALTKRLLDDGHEVTHFNRGLTPVRFQGEVRRVTGDRHSAADLARLGEEGPWDAVVDMCCYHPDALRDTAQSLKGRVGQYVLCSTVDVYRKPAGRYPVTEDEPRASRTQYGRDKAACEDLLHQMGRDGMFHTTVVRPSCTYGEGGVIVHTFGWGTWFLRRLEEGLPVVVSGDGTSLWSWCHVDDAATAFAGAVGNERAFGKSYHFASDEWMTWDQSVATVARALGAPDPKIVHVPAEWLHELAPDESRITWDNFMWPNIYECTLAERELGFRTTVSFAEGAARTVEALRQAGGFAPLSEDPVTERVLEAVGRARAELGRTR